MKRGKRFLENDNLIIYVGTAIFFILAISIGIVMYMSTRTNSEIGKASENNASETQNLGETTENVSTSIGKTVEEQEKTQTEDVVDSDKDTLTQKDSGNKDTTETSTQNTANTTTSNETSVKEDVPDESDTPTSSTEISKPEEDSKTTETKKEVTFTKPTEGEIISEFAKENLIYSETLKEWVTHTGVDIKADKTSVIKSAAAGVVKSIVNDPRYGLTVVISHDEGYETVYSNLLTAEFVVEGEEIEQGQTIGTAGNTAAFESGMECHLHFEILKDGEYLDPSIYLR